MTLSFFLFEEIHPPKLIFLLTIETSRKYLQRESSRLYSPAIQTFFCMSSYSDTQKKNSSFQLIFEKKGRDGKTVSCRCFSWLGERVFSWVPGFDFSCIFRTLLPPPSIRTRQFCFRGKQNVWFFVGYLNVHLVISEYSGIATYNIGWSYYMYM